MAQRLLPGWRGCSYSLVSAHPSWGTTICTVGAVGCGLVSHSNHDLAQHKLVHQLGTKASHNWYHFFHTCSEPPMGAGYYRGRRIFSTRVKFNHVSTRKLPPSSPVNS